MAEERKEDLEFDRMPGSDVKEDEVESVDLNFGLGEEEVTAQVPEPEEEEEEDEEEQPVAAEEEEVAEVEEEPVAEVEEEPVAEVEEEPQQKQHMVPKSRFDQVLARQKELQKKLDEIEKAQQKAELPQYDFDKKEREYQNLLLDGEVEKAAAVRNEIRKAERDRLTAELKDEITQNVQRNQQEMQLLQAAELLAAEFPIFDQNHADYNEEYTQQVIEMRDAFIIMGRDPVAALNQASEYVINKNGIGVTAEPTQNALTAKAAPKKVVDEVARKRAEVGKKLKAAQSQPPELPGDSSASHGEKAYDVTQLSEDEFNALPEATLKRLRGDIF